LRVRAGDFIDPDEARRIRENKEWKRSDPAEDVWDIDKERAAATYKKEALEAMFRMPSAAAGAAAGSGDAAAEEDPAKSYLCGACGSRVASAADAARPEGRHRHVLPSPVGPVVVVAFAGADGTLDTAAGGAGSPTWGTKRQVLGCACAACKAPLGWSYIAAAGDESDFTALQLTRLRQADD